MLDSNKNSTNNSFDVAIIGAGPGGYVAAIRLAQLGKKVLCVDRKELGGTCLNVGCIPSKSLLHSSHLYEQTTNNLENSGIICTNVSFSLTKMQKNKQETIKKLQQGIASLFKANGITFVQAEASFLDSNNLSIKPTKQTENIYSIYAENIIIATGSKASNLNNIIFDERHILSSTGALELQEVPQKMLIVGGGVIGLEMASIWQRLGSDVTVIEFGSQILASSDQDMAEKMEEILKKQGIKFILNAKIDEVIHDHSPNSAQSLEKKLAAIYSQKNSPEHLTTNQAQQQVIKQIDKILLAVGRHAELSQLNLEKVGVILDKNGKIAVNNRFQSNIPNIFAIGDVISGPMLAHKASDEAMVLAEIIAGVTRENLIHYPRIPSVVYTNPEFASVGYSEKELQQQGTAYEVAKFPLLANGRAQINHDTAGLVKIIYSKKSHKLLGAAIIAQDAGNLIHNFSLLLEFNANLQDIIESSFAHPTIAESLREAAMLGTWGGQAIHYKAANTKFSGNK